MDNDFHILSTNRLLLRQFKPDDLENIFRGLSDPEIIKYYGVSYSSLEDTKNQLNFFYDLEKNGTGIWWAICSADNKIFNGACGLNDLDKDHKKAEIGYWLLKEHWGKGYITEAIPLVIKYGFEQLGLHRIEAVVETENTNSKKLMERLDFGHEGTLMECELKNGKYISLDIYAKLNLNAPV